MNDSDNFIGLILRALMKRLECTAIKFKDENKYQINIKGLSSESKYMLEFDEVDNAGTLGVKIRWLLGKISNSSCFGDILNLNNSVLIDRGILFATTFEYNNEVFFGLVGSAVLPGCLSPEEASSIIINHALINYFIGVPDIKGVTPL